MTDTVTDAAWVIYRTTKSGRPETLCSRVLAPSAAEAVQRFICMVPYYAAFATRLEAKAA